MSRHEPEWRPGCRLHYHDTYPAYQYGCRCPAARDAARRYQKRRAAGRYDNSRIDGRGTRRRIQALWALGWTSVPLLSAQEVPVADQLPRVVRALVLAEREGDLRDVRHAYLGGTSALREDLS